MGTGTDGGRRRRRQGRRQRRGGRPLQRKQRDHPPLHLLPSPSPVGRTRCHSMPCVSPLLPVGTADLPPPERRTTPLPHRRHAASCPPALLPLIRLSFALMAGCRVTFCRIAFTLHCAPPFPVHSMHGSIAAAPFASSSRCPLSLPLHCRCAVHHPRR
jgi:hypothetical protein